MQRLLNELSKYNIDNVNVDEKMTNKLFDLFAKDIIDYDDKSGLYQNYLGLYYENKFGNHEKAIACFKTTIEINDDYRFFGLYNYARKTSDIDYKKSIAYYKKCIENGFYPEYTEYSLMLVYGDNRMWKEALPLVGKILKRKDYRALLHLSVFYSDYMGNNYVAKILSKIAIKNGIELGKRNLAIYLFNEKEYKNSIDILDTIDMKLIPIKFEIYDLYVKCFILLIKNEKESSTQTGEYLDLGKEYLVLGKDYYKKMIDVGTDKQICKFFIDVISKKLDINCLFI